MLTKKQWIIAGTGAVALLLIAFGFIVIGVLGPIADGGSRPNDIHIQLTYRAGLQQTLFAQEGDLREETDIDIPVACNRLGFGRFTLPVNTRINLYDGIVGRTPERALESANGLTVLEVTVNGEIVIGWQEVGPVPFEGMVTDYGYYESGFIVEWRAPYVLRRPGEYRVEALYRRRSDYDDGLGIATRGEYRNTCTFYVE